MATNLAVMKMYDDGKLDFKKRLSYYLHYTRKHPVRKQLLVSDLLLHRSGFVPFIPFYKESLTVTDGEPNYSSDSTAFYSIKVADKMYLRHDYPESMRTKMLNSEIKEMGKYVYSDINFYLLKEIVEQQYKKGIDQITREKFYAPLGLSTMTYLPLKKFNANRIAPTENDTVFRKQLLDGYVHDQGAAMLGGVAGHAGLFSNANDVAIVMQMLLNNGTYGGVTYFKPNTVKKFTAKQMEGNRRGLGFDKPDADPKKSPTCESASLATFGHTGFTGTAAWADPKTGLVYVFLSNRIHPSAENKKLIELNVRTEIQQVIYDAMK
jgi:CubicO group peptidase (beta-lactamase class C family)